MGNELDRWREDDKALDAERRRMNAALTEVREARAAGDKGRLVFVLDLTGSREHSLKQARIATAAMFDATQRIGAVAVKLIYYRGQDECRESGWQDNPGVLSRSMARLACETGMTQIARALRRTLAVTEKLSGVVFVGDQCEENAEDLAGLAALLGKKKVPLFVFHECADDNERSLAAKPLFKRMAAASGGVYSEFKPDSGATLRELLSSVGAFSAAGVEGLRQAPLPQTPEARELRGRLLMLPSSEKSAGRFDVLRRKG
jgi:hypothetical protein